MTRANVDGVETLDPVVISPDGKHRGGRRKAPPPKHHQRRKCLDRTGKALGRLGMSGQLGAFETFEQLEPLIRTSV